MAQLLNIPTADLNPHPKIALGALQSPSLHATLRRESTDLAYLLGAWAAFTGVGSTSDDRISYASKDHRQLALIEERFARVTGKAPTHQEIILKGAPYQRITLHSEEVAQHFQRTTANNSHVPWEHLGTEAERIHYLRGIFDHGGWIFTQTSPGIGLNKQEGEHLLRDIGRVFVKIGIFPLVTDTNVPSLRLKERAEWVLFASKIGLSLPERQRDAQSLADRPAWKNYFGLEHYAAVQRCLETGTTSAGAISEITGVPANSVRDWIIRGQKPPVVKRKEIIDEYSQKMADPNVIHFVYRHLGASSQLARECGKRASLKAVKDVAHQERGAIHRIYGDNARIAELLLGSWTTPAPKSHA